MKLINFSVIIACIYFFSCNQAFCAETVLSVAQIKKLFSNKTMTVKQVKHKDAKPMKVYTDINGAVRVKDEKKGLDKRTWHTSKNGRLCFSRSFRRHDASGSTCGFIVSDGSGSYRFYQSRTAEIQYGKLVGPKKKDLILVFSHFSKGYHLK